MIHPSSKCFIDVAGIRTGYFCRGSGDTVVLLLHHGLFARTGFCADAIVWEHNLEALGTDFRVLALDLLGSGDTDLPAAPASYSCDAVLAHVCGFLDALGIQRAHCVGHDEGALVAMQAALRHSDRVASCTVVNSPALVPSGDAVPNETLSAMPQPHFSAQSQAWVLNRQSHAPHHIGTGHLLEVAAAHAGRDKFKALLAQLADPRIERQIAASASRAKIDTFVHLRERGAVAPILMVWGVDDPMTASSYVSDWGTNKDSNSSIGYARSLFNLVRAHQTGARLSLISRAGYMPHRERPAIFNAILGGFIHAVEAAGRR